MEIILWRWIIWWRISFMWYSMGKLLQWLTKRWIEVAIMAKWTSKLRHFFFTHIRQQKVNLALKPLLAVSLLSLFVRLNLELKECESNKQHSGDNDMEPLFGSTPNFGSRLKKKIHRQEWVLRGRYFKNSVAWGGLERQRSRLKGGRGKTNWLRSSWQIDRVFTRAGARAIGAIFAAISRTCFDVLSDAVTAKLRRDVTSVPLRGCRWILD